MLLVFSMVLLLWAMVHAAHAGAGDREAGTIRVAEHGSNMFRETTIAAADEALYRTKREGQNRVTVRA